MYVVNFNAFLMFNVLLFCKTQPTVITLVACLHAMEFPYYSKFLFLIQQFLQHRLKMYKVTTVLGFQQAVIKEV